MELTPEQEEKLDRLLKNEDTLNNLAKKEEAWTLVGSTIKRVALWVAVVGGAVVFGYDKIKLFVQSLTK